MHSKILLMSSLSQEKNNSNHQRETKMMKIRLEEICNLSMNQRKQGRNKRH